MESVRGFFSDTHRVVEPYGHPVFVSVFQMEVLAILEPCCWLGHDPSPRHNIVILIDQQAAIKALNSVFSFSGGGAVQGRAEETGPHTPTHLPLGS